MQYQIGDSVEVRIRAANVERRLHGRVAGRPVGLFPQYQVAVADSIGDELLVFVGEEDLTLHGVPEQGSSPA